MSVIFFCGDSRTARVFSIPVWGEFAPLFQLPGLLRQEIHILKAVHLPTYGLRPDQKGLVLMILLVIQYHGYIDGATCTATY